MTGAVDESTKDAAIAGCLALVQPSYFESFSIVLCEAWAHRRPAIVQGRCEVLLGQARRSGGAIPYVGYGELEAAIELLGGDPALRAELGAAGRVRRASLRLGRPARTLRTVPHRRRRLAARATPAASAPAAREGDARSGPRPTLAPGPARSGPATPPRELRAPPPWPIPNARGPPRCRPAPHDPSRTSGATASSS